MSPTQRTLKLLRESGATAQVVEKWNPHSKTRQDLFGVIDVVSIRAGLAGVLGVQACAGASHAARRAKALAEPKARLWVECGNRLWILSWSKKGARGKVKKWEPRIDEISIGDFSE